jgi:hypothetical protein
MVQDALFDYKQMDVPFPPGDLDDLIFFDAYDAYRSER